MEDGLKKERKCWNCGSYDLDKFGNCNPCGFTSKDTPVKKEYYEPTNELRDQLAQDWVFIRRGLEPRDLTHHDERFINETESFTAGWDARAALDHSAEYLEGSAEWEDEARIAKMEVKLLRNALERIADCGDDELSSWQEAQSTARMALKGST